MDKISTQKNTKRLRLFMAVAAAGMLIFYLVCPVAPIRWHDLYLSYGKTAIAAMAAVYFFSCGFSGVIEVKLVIFYTIWFFLTRLLNTDLYLQNELDITLSRVLCCVILPVGLLLEADQRRRLLDVVIAVFCGFYLVTALLGLYACIFGVYFYLPPEHTVFGIDNYFYGYAFYYIIAWETNRTISAVWFYLAWCSMAYEFFRCRNKLWRIPICLAWLVFHLSIAFCFCRSIKLAVCLNVAMVVLLVGIRHIRLRSGAVKALLLALLAAVSMLAAYKSFDGMTAASAYVYNQLDTDIERTSNAFFGPNYKKRNEEYQTFTDSRDMKVSVSGLSGRSTLYKTVLPALKAEPRRILIGKLSQKVMDYTRAVTNYPYYHIHNYLLQVLLLTGVPGFLLVLAFSLLLVTRCIRLFFSKAALSDKLLILPLTGVLLYGMLETIIFTDSADQRALTDFRELFFFFVAGIVLAFYYEQFPPKSKQKTTLE